MNMPKEDPVAQMKQIDRRQPNRMWQQAMDVTKATDPGLVVAAADFLVEHGEYGHAAEVLKAGIRLGLTADQWAHDALAVALKSSGGQTLDVEKAAMSAIDLAPSEAKAYLKAAKAADDAGRVEVALAYCRRAADLDSNMPLAYANALVYAEKAGDVKTDAIQWASDNLLRRDWADDGVNYHAETRTRLGKIVGKFEAAGRKEAVESIRKALELEAQRDLVIELLWQGEADLDLSVTEPTGSTASATHKRTVGGGVLKADVLEQGNDKSEIYTAAQAFSGKYTITAKQAFKTAVGSKAQVKVTMFKGTDRETVEFHTINFADAKPVSITVVGGSRSEMVQLADTEPAMLTFTNDNGQRGFAGGSSTTGTERSVLGTRNVPTVMKKYEEKLPGFAPNAPTIRAEADITPDRKHVRVTVSPVVGETIPTPRVSLLPGGQ
jgi:tetratricopeptide (TPR) repeat protein